MGLTGEITHKPPGVLWRLARWEMFDPCEHLLPQSVS